jgi:hypothetical protein
MSDSAVSTASELASSEKLQELRERFGPVLERMASDLERMQEQIRESLVELGELREDPGRLPDE